MAKGLRQSIRPKALQFVLWAVVAFLLVDALAKFKLVDYTSYVNPIFLPIVLSLFILLDVGIMQVIKNKKKLDAIDWFSVVIAGIILLSVALTLIGVELAFLTTAQGYADILLGIVVIINIFKK